MVTLDPKKATAMRIWGTNGFLKLESAWGEGPKVRPVTSRVIAKSQLE